MGGAERIEFAFCPLREAAEPSGLPDRPYAVAAAGDDLVRIALVANVPDQFVVRRIEHIMDGDGQLDNAKARSKMSAGLGYRRDHLAAQLIGQLRQLRLFQGTEFSGEIDLI